MGKRILVQRRGRGGRQFRAPALGLEAQARYPLILRDGSISGVVTTIIHDGGRTAPMAQVRFDDGSITYLPATNGLQIGSRIELGPNVPPVSGNVLPISRIPEGSTICNIERNFGDGGSLARAAGASAIVSAHAPTGVSIKLPSGKTILLRGECRATVGGIAGAGRTERPFLKAGQKYHFMRVRGGLYPRVRGVAMAAVHHPFGGGRHQHPGKSTSTSRYAPPGRKVGHIAPRTTGRGGKRQRGL